MSQFSDYIEPLVLDAIFNAVALTGPNSMYVSLYTVTPTDAGGGTEVSAGGYARLKVQKQSGSAPKWTSAVVDAPGFKVSNENTLTFGPNTAAWGAVLAFGVWDHLTTGNLLMWGALDTTKTLGVNDTLSWAIGALKLRAE